MLRNGTCVPKGCFAAAKHPAKLGFGCENGVFKALRISQPFCSCEMRVGGCEMALVCQEVFSQLRKFSQSGAWGCEMLSQQSGDFAGGYFGCEIISQPRAIFAEASFGCKISQAMNFSLLLNSFLAPRDLPSFSLQFLLH